jgi:hypothetical protein
VNRARRVQVVRGVRCGRAPPPGAACSDHEHVARHGHKAVFYHIERNKKIPKGAAERRKKNPSATVALFLFIVCSHAIHECLPTGKGCRRQLASEPKGWVMSTGSHQGR